MFVAGWFTDVVVNCGSRLNSQLKGMPLASNTGGGGLGF